MEFLSIFAERLKELMEDGNHNTLSLQKLCGIQNSNISNWLNKKVVPSTRHLITLSCCLNCSVDFLIGRAELPAIKDVQFKSSLALRLTALARERKKSLHAIAKELKIDEAILYRWAKGKFVPNIEGLITLSDYFTCSVDYLLGREE